MTQTKQDFERAELRRIAAVVLQLPGKEYFAGFQGDSASKATAVRTTTNLADAKFFYPTNPAKINDAIKRIGACGIVPHPMNVALNFEPYQPYRGADRG